MLSIFVPQVLIAGEYKLISGQNNPVCQAYRANLEPRHDDEPMACERRYDPSIRGFSSPNWHKLALADNLELFRKAWLYLQENNNSPQGMKLSDKEVEQEASAHLRDMAKSTHVELYTASLDLVGDGRLRKILALVQDGCGPHPRKYPGGQITRLFVLDGAGKNIDTTVPEIWNTYSNGTIEIFNGRPFLESYMADDNWGKLLTGSGSLSVFQFTADGTSEVCEVTWTPNSSGRKQDR